MGLIDEVVSRVDAELERGQHTWAKDAVRAVLGEMFEERATDHFAPGREMNGLSWPDRWFAYAEGEADYIGELAGGNERQTILVPRAKAEDVPSAQSTRMPEREQPTLAEAQRELITFARDCRADDPALGCRIDNLDAALAREGRGR
jgi:hypothetical protein